MKFKKIRILFLIMVLSLVFISCDSKQDINGENANNQEDIAEDKVKGGEINLPIIHMKALNPLLNSSSSAFYFKNLIFEGLFEFDENLEPIEHLVENYKINKDKTIDITLKQDILWHNGQELKAKDVKFTIDTIKFGVTDGRYNEQISDMYKADGILNINNISEVDVKDDYNITIYFEENSCNILEILTLPIISSNALENNYEKALESQDYMPIGTGPYKQEKHEKLKFINLEAYNQYWGQAPFIEKINGRILKDEELLLTSFEAGQVDLAFSLGSEWEKYSQDEMVKINEFPSRKYEFLAVNANNTMFEGERGTNIKKAIAYAIDRDKIIERVYLGHAVKTNTAIAPQSYLTDKDINNKYKYDIDKARKILEDSGFKDTNNDTMYEDENGNPLTVKLSTNSYDELRVRTLEMIANDLRNIGIEVVKDYEVINAEAIDDSVKELEWNKFESKIINGQFEIALLGWETSLTQDISYMFHSSPEKGTNNFINYSDLKLDKVLDNIDNSITKQEKKRNYIKAQNIIVEELPYISLFFTNGSILSNKKIHGDIKPNYINIYRNINQWFIPKKYQAQTNLN